MTKYTERQTTMREKHLKIKQWFLGATCRAILAGVVVLFGVLYVVETSAVSTKGYDIAAAQKEIQNLEHENERLTFEIAKNQSMESIQARLPKLNFVAVDSIQYVSTVGTAVAIR